MFSEEGGGFLNPLDVNPFDLRPMDLLGGAMALLSAAAEKGGQYILFTVTF